MGDCDQVQGIARELSEDLLKQLHEAYHCPQRVDHKTYKEVCRQIRQVLVSYAKEEGGCVHQARRVATSLKNKKLATLSDQDIFLLWDALDWHLGEVGGEYTVNSAVTAGLKDLAWRLWENHFLVSEWGGKGDEDSQLQRKSLERESRYLQKSIEDSRQKLHELNRELAMQEYERQKAVEVAKNAITSVRATIWAPVQDCRLPDPPSIFVPVRYCSEAMKGVSGVYFAIRKGEREKAELVYVGLSKDIGARWRSHHRIQSDDLVGIIRLPIEQLADAEAYYILKFRPSLNKETKFYARYGSKARSSVFFSPDNGVEIIPPQCGQDFAVA